MTSSPSKPIVSTRLKEKMKVGSVVGTGVNDVQERPVAELNSAPTGQSTGGVTDGGTTGGGTVGGGGGGVLLEPLPPHPPPPPPPLQLEVIAHCELSRSIVIVTEAPVPVRVRTDRAWSQVVVLVNVPLGGLNANTRRSVETRVILEPDNSTTSKLFALTAVDSIIDSVVEFEA